MCAYCWYIVRYICGYLACVEVYPCRLIYEVYGAVCV